MVFLNVKRIYLFSVWIIDIIGKLTPENLILVCFGCYLRQ